MVSNDTLFKDNLFYGEQNPARYWILLISEKKSKLGEEKTTCPPNLSAGCRAKVVVKTREIENKFFLIRNDLKEKIGTGFQLRYGEELEKENYMNCCTLNF